MPAQYAWHQPRIQIPDAGATTDAALEALTGDDRTLTLPWVADVPGDMTALTGANVGLVVPGEWRFTWTITGPGATVRAEIVMVDPAPAIRPAGPVPFATTADLATHLGRPIGPDARSLLADATVEIERITKTAVYPVDLAGRPTDTRVAAALRDATCELVAWWDETGTATGARGLFTSASIAGVSLGYGGSGSANPQADRVGPRIWSILLSAGLVDGGAVGVRG